MIIISDLKNKSISVEFPGNIVKKTKPTRIEYKLVNDGFIFDSGEINKKIIVDKHLCRTLIFFDIIIKAKDYNYNVTNIYYKGKNLLNNTFPNMDIELTEEEKKLEKKIIYELQNGVDNHKNINSEDYKIILDLFNSNGIK